MVNGENAKRSCYVFKLVKSKVKRSHSWNTKLWRVFWINQPCSGLPQLLFSSYCSSTECLMSSTEIKLGIKWMASVNNSPVSIHKRGVDIGTIGLPLVLRNVLLLLKFFRDNHTLHWHKLELNTLKYDKRSNIREKHFAQRLYSWGFLSPPHFIQCFFSS